MKDKDIILKDVKNLEYSNLISKQNIWLVISGTGVISTILSDIHGELTKGNLILTFILIFFLFFIFYNKELEDKINEIKNM